MSLMTSPRTRFLRRGLSRVEVALVRRTGRSIVSVLLRTEVLVLETTGRRTGRPRRTVLAHRRLDATTVLVVGGAAGQTMVPDWVANLQAGSAARVVVDRIESAVEVRELDGDERARRWSELCRVWPRIIEYERRSGRIVPVFALRRTDSGDVGTTPPGDEHEPNTDGEQPPGNGDEESDITSGERQ